MQTSFHHALYKAFHARKNRIRPGMTKLGLSPGQPKILEHLSAQGGCMQREIAEACDIEPATVSRILKNMEQSGLIRREQAPDSNRAFSISITEKGWDVLRQWMELYHEVEEVSLQGFSEEERRLFMGFLSRCYQNLTGKAME